MVTDEQKEHILRVIPLNVSFETACIQAKVPLEDIEVLEKDPEFQKEIQYAKAWEESRLAQLYSQTVEKAAEIKLDYKGLRDRLELMNPARYDLKTIKEDLHKSKRPEDEEEILRITLPSNGRD